MTSSLWLYTPSGLTNCITNMSVFSVGRLVDPGMNDLLSVVVHTQWAD